VIGRAHLIGGGLVVSQQGDRVAGGAPDAEAALTYAIWGPFEAS
jgi:hypothetical protein